MTAVPRRRVLAALSATLVSRALPARAAAPVAVAVGLDRIEADRGGALRGRKVGLLAHAASVTADGRHAIDVLREVGVRSERLFGPEHGLRGRAAAGERIEDGVDASTGLPVVSLYGGKQAPEARDLAGLDALVVDLQGAGVRFYTYVSTMLLCLEPAAEAGVEVVVLDRPNPLGGAQMAGPEADPHRTFHLVSVAPGPLVHGLTMGEMARLANERRRRPARLRVVSLQGWDRPMTWLDTGRSWVAPSPNLRTAEAALVYPGTCLVEATNVSEGRGTDAPFLEVGSPWLKAKELAAAAAGPGVDLEPIRFTPAPGPAAPRPKYAGADCAGVRVRVEDARNLRPYAFGLGLLAALKRLHPEFAWERGGEALDTLLGTATVRAALDRGERVEAILASDQPAIERFARERRSALLY
jgi:uncharacterized protein YbbC (DUF1343 family)